jgi:hypothetical protein
MMPGPRSKRKRSEMENPSEPLRRRGRDVASGPESIGDEKNEGLLGNNASLIKEDRIQSTTSNALANSLISSLHSASGNLNDTGGNDHAEEGNLELKSQDEILRDKSSVDSTAKNSAYQPMSQHMKMESITATSEPSTKNEDQRIARIRRALDYRKDLLDRIKRGKSATQSTLNVAYAKNSSLREETDVQEIAAFQNVTKEVNAFARKQTRIDFEGEKRTVTLRRGSSVGKRMNTALASLAPSSAAAASVAALSADLSSSSQSTYRPQIKSPSSGLSRAVSLGSALSSMSSSINLQPLVVASSTSKKASSPSAANIAPIAAPTRPASTKSSKTPSLLSRSVSTPGPLLQVAIPMPPPATAVPSIPTPRAIQPQPPPVVVCSETIALRERQNALRDKLVATLKSRPEYAMSIQQQRKPGQIKKDKSRLERVKLLENVEVCARLPNRRQTHWDYLLDEMRWMATDFREERKWKESASRILAKGAMLKQASAVVLGERKSKDVRVNGSSKHVVVKLKDEGSLEKSIRTLRTSSVDSTSGYDLMDQKYKTPTADELKAAICISRNLAAKIQRDIYNSRLKPEIVDEIQLDAQSKKIDRSLSNDNSNTVSETVVETPSNDIVSKNADDAAASHESNNVSVSDTASKVTAEATAAYLLEIESRVNELVDKADSLTTKPTRSNVKASTKNSYEAKLTVDQSAIAHKVEEYWTKVPSGVSLTGPHSCGKTFTVCALLWDCRDAGAHVIFCTPTSVVSQTLEYDAI